MSAVPMNPRLSLGVYPRRDTAFKGKHSLNFDMMRTKIFLERDNRGEKELWLAHFICGLLCGFQAFCISWMENQIVGWRVQAVQKIVSSHDNHLTAAYFYWIFSSMFFVTISALMTVYIAPAAMGSGVAEVMGLLNGINYDKAIAVNTLFVKIFGTLFAICAGLCIGKEGPLVHIGAIIGAMCCFMPF